jgi:uncharacterized membrane protein YccC
MAMTFRILAWISLVCAGFIACVTYEAHHSGGWFPGLLDNLASTLIPLFVVLGLLGFLGTARWGRQNRNTAVGLGLGITSERKGRAD